MDEDFLVMDVENLEYADARFDVVYALGALLYAHGSRRMINEANSVLKPDGEGIFNLIPKFVIRRFGRHIRAKVTE